MMTKRFPDITVRVKSDLMSLTQLWWFRESDGFSPTATNTFPLHTGYRRRSRDKAEIGEEGKEAQEAWKEIARCWSRWWNQRWRWGGPRFFIVWLHVQIWGLTLSCGPVSVYDMLQQPDSEPLAGPKNGLDHWSESDIAATCRIGCCNVKVVFLGVFCHHWSNSNVELSNIHLWL